MRSARPDVRNPLLKLPSAADLELLPAPAIEALRNLATNAAIAWRAAGDEAWKKNKPPIAAYWRAWSVNARHLRRLCNATLERKAAS